MRMNLSDLARRIRRSGFRISSGFRFENVKQSEVANSYHGGHFGQDYRDDTGRLVHEAVVKGVLLVITLLGLVRILGDHFVRS